MTAFYVDYEASSGGNGSSFANRAQKISDITGATGGDVIRVKKSPDGTTVGTAKVLRRPTWSPYGLTAGTLTKSTTQGESTFAYANHGCIDDDWVYLQGATAGEGVNGIWKITKVNDDNFKLNEYTAPSTGSVSSIKFLPLGSSVVELASAVTQTIASTGPRNTAWTASTNVSSSIAYSYSEWTSSSNYLIAPGSDEIAIAAGFGTGKAAYFATGSLDLSGYQQVSFYVATSTGTYTDNLSLRLCTDTAGATSVHTIPIKLTQIQGTNKFVPQTVDLGANLGGGSSIQSIALYVDSDEGAQTIRLHNIIACKASSSADSLTLNSVIGLDTTDDPQWYAPVYINGKAILIGHGTNGYNLHSYYAKFSDRWSATNASATLKKRQPINHHTFTNGSSTNLDAVATNGTTSDFLTISGGWNTTDMSSQDTNGETFIDCIGPNGKGLNISKNHIALDKISYIRGSQGIYCGGTRLSIDNLNTVGQGDRPAYYQSCSFVKLNHNATGGRQSLYIANCSKHDSANISNFNLHVFGCGEINGCVNLASSTVDFNLINVENAYQGVDINNTSNITITNIKGGNTQRDSSNSAVKVRTRSNNVTIGTLTSGDVQYGYVNDGCKNLVINNCNISTVGSTNIYIHRDLMAAGDNKNGCTTTINGGTSAVQVNSNQSSTVKTYSLELTGTSEHNIATGGVILSSDHDNVSGAIKNSFEYATIIPETSIRNTASGVSWKTSITNSNKYTASGPLTFDLGKVVCAASAQVTVTLKVYRSSTNIFGGIKIPASYPLGLTSSVVSYCSGSAGAWETVTATFTPSAAGSATIQAAFYATDASSSVYIDDISITQA
tara:strand:+ start:1064 stop:3574 length:2511 start_codon:yes stop_codon:yes gene_type:complete